MIQGLGGDDRIYGGRRNDRLKGEACADALSGSWGADVAGRPFALWVSIDSNTTDDEMTVDIEKD